jgi:hypothetical protein
MCGEKKSESYLSIPGKDRLLCKIGDIYKGSYNNSTVILKVGVPWAQKGTHNRYNYFLQGTPTLKWL